MSNNSSNTVVLQRWLKPKTALNWQTPKTELSRVKLAKMPKVTMNKNTMLVECIVLTVCVTINYIQRIQSYNIHLYKRTTSYGHRKNVEIHLT